MKHYVLAIALAALSTLALFTGCSSDDDFDAQQEQTAQSGQTPIGFGSYLNRSVSTRGAAYLHPSEIALNGNIGLFSMHTEGGKYGSTANGGTFPNFTANLMNNVELKSSLTEKQLQNQEGDIANSWVYSPLRYWPLDANDYVSFMAYAPFGASKKLYTKDGETTGDLTYIQHTVANDPKDQIDLLYADPTDIANMQLYPTKSEKGFYNNGTNVDLKFKHATSRIGFVVTSSALRSKYNYGVYSNGTWIQGGKPGDALWVQIGTYDLDANVSITVNKVKFLGDNVSAEKENPVGAFLKNGYLNLSSGNDDNLWSTTSTDKIAIAYDNTNAIRTISGLYDGSDQGTVDFSDGTSSKQYKWVPNDLIYTDEWKNEFKEDLMKRGYSEYLAEYYAEGYQDYYLTKQNLVKGTMRAILDENYEPITDEDGYIEREEAEVSPIGNSADDYMFVIPQEYKEGNDLWVYLDYTVNYEGGVSGDVKENGINYKVYRKINQKFEPGKAYIVVMDIGKADENGTSLSFNSVNFSVQLDPWADEESVQANY